MKHSISKLFKSDKEDTNNKEEERIQEIKVQEIVPNRFQPRTVFKDDRIDELSQTIQSHGLIQPIVVRKYKEKFEIIAGERRWRAATKLGWEKVPAIIKDYGDEEAASVALIENLQREELTAIEEAMAYAKLLDIHGLTQETLALQLGKGQSTIANKLRLLKLPGSVQEALLERKITERHARALISLKSTEKQEKLLQEIIEKHLNVKQVEDRINKMTEIPKPKPKRRSYNKNMRLALNTIRQSVDMVTDSGMAVETDEREEDSFYEITIRITK